MTIYEQYNKEDRWHIKIILMEIFHLVRKEKDPKWTMEHTAAFFGVSKALVSENLKLAKALNWENELINCKSRVEALRRLNGSDVAKSE